MAAWNAEHYLKYGDERTRAAADLLMRIQLQNPRMIADLGCGPGNSTQLLRERWPEAELVGVDHSMEMLQAARESYPDGCWVQADLIDWVPDQPCDLIYSNAALQWVSDHHRLLERLFSLLQPGGVLAFQIPSGTFAPIRTLTHEVSQDPRWNDRMGMARSALTMESPAFYYDAFAGQADRVDIWETEYFHVMESAEAVMDWMASTGLRPFLAALDDEAERQLFWDRLKERVNEAYALRCDGRVLHPFRRTFVIASAPPFDRSADGTR